MQNLLIVSDNVAFQNDLAAALKKHVPGLRSLQFMSYANAAIKLHTLGDREIVLIDIRSASGDCMAFAKALLHQHSGVKAVGVGQPQDASLLLSLVKLGVKDFIAYPIDEAEIKGLDLKEIPSTGGSEARRSGKLITVCSPKGGTGVTLFSTNFAVTIAKRRDLKVLLFDPSDQCGDTATYLNLSPKYTVRDVLDSEGAIDASLIEGMLLQHASGIRILAAPKPEQAGPGPDHLAQMRSLIHVLKSMFDVIVLDAGTMHPVLLQYALSESDTVLLMGNPDVVSIKGLIVFYNKFKAAHLDTTKVRVIMNRYNSKSQIDAKEFEKVTHHPVAFYLPNNYPLCIEAVNAGQPLSDRSDLSRKIAEIAHTVLTGSEPSSEPAAPAKKGGFRCFL